jgi:replication factor A1
VQFHYALVDDLISKEEFERRVEEKIEQCGDLIDETTAGLIIVQELGRSHVKISGLSGNSSLYSFFGKVISVSPPREFTRKDGEKGFVAHLILADESGQVRAVLWDEKAAAVKEIGPGEVLEVIGKHASGGRNDIVVLALRKSPCEITCGSELQAPFIPAERKELTARVLFIDEPRTILKKDGSETVLLAGCVAEREGTARIITFSPDLFAGLAEGSVVRITGALEKTRTTGREYVIDERSRVTSLSAATGGSASEGQEIPFRFTAPGEVRAGETCSVEGTIASLQPVRTFVARDGRQGQVRNLRLTDGLAELRVVLWGDRALQPLVPGDRIAVYLGEVRNNREGERELHAGAGCFIRLFLPEFCQETGMEGTVIVTRDGTFLDNGRERFLLCGDLPHGHEVRVRGQRAGERFVTFTLEEVQKDPAAVSEELEKLLAELDRNNTFTLHGCEDI